MVRLKSTRLAETNSHPKKNAGPPTAKPPKFPTVMRFGFHVTKRCRDWRCFVSLPERHYNGRDKVHGSTLTSLEATQSGQGRTHEFAADAHREMFRCFVASFSTQDQETSHIAVFLETRRSSTK